MVHGNHLIGGVVSASGVSYELIQVGDDVVLPVESARLYELYGASGGVEVGRRCSGDEVAEVCEVLAAPGQYFQRDQVCCGCDRSFQAGQNFELLGGPHDLAFDSRAGESRSITKSEPVEASRTPDSRST